MANLFIQPDESIERRRQLAEAMMMRGQQQGPVQHWTQGADRIANALLGSYFGKKAETEEAERQGLARETLAQAMAEMRSPENPMTEVDGANPYDMGQPTGDPISRFAQVLAGNPDLRDYATQIELQNEQAKQKLLTGTGQPSSVREYEYWRDLKDSDAQNKFLNLKRSGVQKVDGQLYDTTGGNARGLLTENQQMTQADIQAEIDRLTAMSKEIGKGQGQSDIAEQVANARRQVKSAEARGTAEGKRAAQEEADFPQYEAGTNEAVALVDKALDHPGLSYAVGKTSPLPIIPGTEAANFMTVLNQITGKNFLAAFESLKGAGQITEVEGQKAQQAFARLDRAQTEDEFKASLVELKGILQAGLERKRNGVQKISGAPEVGMEQDGYIFLGGNPADPNNWKQK
jgi:hypothetical protein